MFIDNINVKLHKILKEQIEKHDEVIIASAFITDTDLIRTLMEGKTKFTLIFRLSYPATPEFLTELLDLESINSKIYFFYDGHNRNQNYHPKTYLFKNKGESLSAITGSSNFTYGGLSNNHEFNIFLTENLGEIEKYCNLLIAESDGPLSREIVNEYKKYYVKPENHKYRQNNLSNERIKKYRKIMVQWNRLKGELEEFNHKKLPFTYVYDYFCHQFKTKMEKLVKVPPSTFNKNLLVDLFKEFLDEHFDEDHFKSRKSRHIECKRIHDNIETVSINELRRFYLKLLSVSSGSGSGLRRTYFETEATKNEMKNLLLYVIRGDEAIEFKYATGLVKRLKGGEGIAYIGESGLGEIIGWLLPDEYPIVNSKFLHSIDFFKI